MYIEKFNWSSGSFNFFSLIKLYSWTLTHAWINLDLLEPLSIKIKKFKWNFAFNLIFVLILCKIVGKIPFNSYFHWNLCKSIFNCMKKVNMQAWPVPIWSTLCSYLGKIRPSPINIWIRFTKNMGYGSSYVLWHIIENNRFKLFYANNWHINIKSHPRFVWILHTC